MSERVQPSETVHLTSTFFFQNYRCPPQNPSETNDQSFGDWWFAAALEAFYTGHRWGFLGSCEKSPQRPNGSCRNWGIGISMFSGYMHMIGVKTAQCWPIPSATSESHLPLSHQTSGLVAEVVGNRRRESLAPSPTNETTNLYPNCIKLHGHERHPTVQTKDLLSSGDKLQPKAAWQRPSKASQQASKTSRKERSSVPKEMSTGKWINMLDDDKSHHQQDSEEL